MRSKALVMEYDLGVYGHVVIPSREYEQKMWADRREDAEDYCPCDYESIPMPPGIEDYHARRRNHHKAWYLARMSHRRAGEPLPRQPARNRTKVAEFEARFHRVENDHADIGRVFREHEMSYFEEMVVGMWNRYHAVPINEYGNSIDMYVPILRLDRYLMGLIADGEITDVRWSDGGFILTFW